MRTKSFNFLYSELGQFQNTQESATTCNSSGASGHQRVVSVPVTKESGSYRLKNEKQSAVAGSLLNKKDFIFHTVKSNKYNCIMRCSLVGMHTKREGWFAIVGGQMCVTDYILKSCTKKDKETIGRPRS